jgi:hypothetical protein
MRAISQLSNLGPDKNAALRCPACQGILAELRSVETSPFLTRIVIQLQSTSRIIGLVNLKSTYCGFVFLISSRSRLIETSSATAIPPDSIASFQVIPNFLRLI